MHPADNHAHHPHRSLGIAIAVQSLAAVFGILKPSWCGYLDMQQSFSEVIVYRNFAAKIVAGAVPYRDFLLEYPPLAVPFFLAPLPGEWALSALVGGGRLTPVAAYGLTFTALMTLTSLALTWLTARQAHALGGAAAVRPALLCYTACFLALTPLAVTRFDLVPTALSFAGVVLLTTGRSVAGGVVLGLGALAKFVPGVALLPTLCASPRDVPWAAKGRAVLGAGLCFGLGVLVWVAIGRGGVADSLRYHTERGLEMGSTWTGVFLLLHTLFGYPAAFRYDHLSAGVDTPHSALAAQLATPAMLAAFALVAWRAWQTRATPQTTFRLAAATLLAYIVAGKVLSPQYMVWLLPFVALVGTAAERWLFFACCLTTTIGWPWNMISLSNLGLRGAVLTFGRNAGLLVLFALLLRSQQDQRSPQEQADIRFQSE